MCYCVHSSYFYSRIFKHSPSCGYPVSRGTGPSPAIARALDTLVAQAPSPVLSRLKTGFRSPDRQITRSHLRRASRPYPPSSSQIIPVWRRVQRFTHDWRRVPFAPPTPTPYVDPIRTKVTQLDPILRASAEGRTITKQRDAITDIPQPV